MYAKTIPAALIIGALFLGGCTTREDSRVEVSIEDRDDLAEEYREKIAEMRAELDEMEDETPEVRARFKAELDELEVKLDGLGRATERGWERTKSEFTQAFRRVQREFDELG